MTRGRTRPAPGQVFRVDAPAKVNLLLRILEPMPDGFHRLETLFQAVDLMDHLTVEVVSGGDVELRVSGADVGPAEANLVTRAVRLFRSHTGSSTGLRITLQKGIPAGAGLGGGSSDAGATLRTLNLAHGSPLDLHELTSLGGALGADVAFFAGESGLSMGEGRGERLTALPGLPTRPLVLGLPPVHVATGPAYGALASARAGQPPPSRVLHPPPGDWVEVEARALNDFEGVVPQAHPLVGSALQALRRAGASTALLSGSGSAVFGLFPGDEPRPDTLQELRRAQPGIRWVAAQTLDRLPRPVRVEPEEPFR